MAFLRSGPIRYARAERFQAPVRAGADDERPARGQACPQLRSRLEAVMGRPGTGLPQSEDCLHLSLTTPAMDDGARPVLVFFHGGAFTSGSGLLDWYHGGRLTAEGDVVVVSASYRLGAFGYLRLDGVSEGNLGLRDQIEALAWVHDNIVRYGGDPGNVTVIGQSAGGMSIRCMLEIPAARNLFRRAIVQSAPVGIAAQAAPAATRAGLLFRDHLGQDPRSAPADAMLAAHRSTAGAFREFARDPVEPPFGPVLGSPLPPALALAPQPAAAAGLDILLGWNIEEMAAFGAGPDVARARTRALFADPLTELARGLDAASATVAGYRLDWRPAGSPYGAGHCVELPLLLGDEQAWRGSPMIGEVRWDEVESFGRGLRAAWLRFARTGTVDPALTSGYPVRWARSADELALLR